MILDEYLKKSKAPYTKEDVEVFLRLYGPACELMVERDNGTITAFALLTPPLPLLGEVVCTVIGAMGAHTLFEKVKARARAWGATTLKAVTYRNGKAMARLMHGEIDGTVIKWDLLSKEHNHASTAIPDIGARSVPDSLRPSTAGTSDPDGAASREHTPPQSPNPGDDPELRQRQDEIELGVERPIRLVPPTSGVGAEREGRRRGRRRRRHAGIADGRG